MRPLPLILIAVAFYIYSVTTPNIAAHARPDRNDR